MTALQMAAQQDLEKIRQMIEDITGLPSRWSGTLNVDPVSSVAWGVKHWSCNISIREDVLRRLDQRWTTMIHESLHAVSTELNLDAFRTNRGWEEGVIEQTQRILRSYVLVDLNIAIDNARLRDIDRLSAYNNYIRELERLRAHLGIEIDKFYLDLISIPLMQRSQHIRDIGEARFTGSAARAWIHLLEDANRVLRSPL